MKPKTKVAILLRDLQMGGIERLAINLIRELAKRPDLEITLVLCDGGGYLLNEIPFSVKTKFLECGLQNRLSSLSRAAVALSNYLRHARPSYLISMLPVVNVVAATANIMACCPSKVILVEQTLSFERLLEIEQPGADPGFMAALKPMMAWLYPYQHAVVTTSRGMGQEVEQSLGLKHRSVKTIPSPVVTSKLSQKSFESTDNPWVDRDPNIPTFLAVGRMTDQKDFTTLLKAFHYYRRNNKGRLIILGDGDQKQQLEFMARELQIAEDVMMPGTVFNPYPYMSKANALILSSNWEVLPTVLIEAMACGCQVIATNCDHGPSEILEKGRLGHLVQVGDSNAMAIAMEKILIDPFQPKALRDRSMDFSVEASAEAYLALMGID